jgi:hypothetical protein
MVEEYTRRRMSDIEFGPDMQGTESGNDSGVSHQSESDQNPVGDHKSESDQIMGTSMTAKQKLGALKQYFNRCDASDELHIVKHMLGLVESIDFDDAIKYIDQIKEERNDGTDAKRIDDLCVAKKRELVISEFRRLLENITQLKDTAAPDTQTSNDINNAYIALLELCKTQETHRLLLSGYAKEAVEYLIASDYSSSEQCERLAAVLTNVSGCESLISALRLKGKFDVAKQHVDARTQLQELACIYDESKGVEALHSKIEAQAAKCVQKVQGNLQKLEFIDVFHGFNKDSGCAGVYNETVEAMQNELGSALRNPNQDALANSLNWAKLSEHTQNTLKDHVIEIISEIPDESKTRVLRTVRDAILPKTLQSSFSTFINALETNTGCFFTQPPSKTLNARTQTFPTTRT